MAVAATTVKKPSENWPIKQANRRRCERKQKPQNRVIATKGRNWEKTVEDASLLGRQPFKPLCAPCGFHPDAGWTRKCCIKLVDFTSTMVQSTIQYFARHRINRCNLLKTYVKITSD